MDGAAAEMNQSDNRALSKTESLEIGVDTQPGDDKFEGEVGDRSPPELSKEEDCVNETGGVECEENDDAKCDNDSNRNLSSHIKVNNCISKRKLVTSERNRDDSEICNSETITRSREDMLKDDNDNKDKQIFKNSIDSCNTDSDIILKDDREKHSESSSPGVESASLSDSKQDNHRTNPTKESDKIESEDRIDEVRYNHKSNHKSFNHNDDGDDLDNQSERHEIQKRRTSVRSPFDEDERKLEISEESDFSKLRDGSEREENSPSKDSNRLNMEKRGLEKSERKSDSAKWKGSSSETATSKISKNIDGSRSNSELSPPPSISKTRHRMETALVEEKSSGDSSFGESHVNKLMSFVDSLDRKSTHSNHRLNSSSMFSPSLNKPSSSSSSLVADRPSASRASELLYRPYKTSPGSAQKGLVGKMPSREGKSAAAGGDQPLDLSVHKGKSDPRGSPLSSHSISDYNGFRNPFGLSSLEAMRAMFGEGSPMIPSPSGKTSDSKQNSWSSLSNYPANINWQFASSLASLQAQMEAMLMTYPFFKASMDLYKSMMPPYVPNVTPTSEKSAESPVGHSSGSVPSSHGKDKIKRPADQDKNEARTPNGHHRRSPAASASASSRSVSEVHGSEAKKFRGDSSSWLTSKHSSEKPSISMAERKSFYAQAANRKTSDLSRSSSKIPSFSDDKKYSVGELASSSSDEPRAEMDDGTMLTSFACGCGRRFSSLYQLTVHIEESGHSPSQVRVDTVDDFPKLVRGQDLWLSGGQDQRNQTLKCIRCKESFQSLPELTVHMIKSKHYVDIVGQTGDLDRTLLSDTDVLLKLQRGSTQHSSRQLAESSSSKEASRWSCFECLKNYRNEEELSRHLLTSGHQMIPKSRYHSPGLDSYDLYNGGFRDRRRTEGGVSDNDELRSHRAGSDTNIPRAASSGSDRDHCSDRYHAYSPAMRPSSAHVIKRENCSPISNGIPRGVNDVERAASTPDSYRNRMKSPMSSPRETPTKSFPPISEDRLDAEDGRSHPYYNDFMNYRLKRLHNQSPSPAKKRIKTESTDEDGEMGPDDKGIDLPEGERQSIKTREPNSPIDHSQKNYMNLICPPSDNVDGSCTLKAMESFVERSFTSGKFNSPLAMSQNNVNKIGISPLASTSRSYKPRSPGIEENSLLKPYNFMSQSLSAENKTSSALRDYARIYEKYLPKWSPRETLDKKLGGDRKSFNSTESRNEGLLSIKHKKSNSESEQSESFHYNYLKSNAPNSKLSTNNNEKKEAPSSEGADGKYKHDLYSHSSENNDFNFKKRPFTSSTLEYLQNFVDDTALKATGGRDGKKSLISSEGKLSIKT